MIDFALLKGTSAVAEHEEGQRRLAFPAGQKVN